jgi:hypothetical protein
VTAQEKRGVSENVAQKENYAIPQNPLKPTVEQEAG